MKKIKEYAELLAKASLEIGSIQLRPNDPFIWASGTRNPIYNDNRMLLAEYEHRMLVTKSLIDVLAENEIGLQHVDYICGTSLSGIGPASTLADILHKKMLIFVDDTPYEFSSVMNLPIGNSYNRSIVSSAPFGIPLGVLFANMYKLRFSYVRPAVKKHGLKKSIEGADVVNEDFDLINVGDDQAKSNCLSALSNQDLHCKTVTHYSPENIFQKAELSNKCVIVVEDLISTGASFAKEADACKKAGAEVLCVLTIFNYELESSKELIAKAGYEVYSALTYQQLLQTAVELKFVDENQLKVLKEWREDQPNWGDKHGFPVK